ncbi:hypothetical protein OC844_003127 [Tilletia horrida]|nr:hypothetical protein OC844_003127 [Tilletia horrida]
MSTHGSSNSSSAQGHGRLVPAQQQQPSPSSHAHAHEHEHEQRRGQLQRQYETRPAMPLTASPPLALSLHSRSSVHAASSSASRPASGVSEKQQPQQHRHQSKSSGKKRTSSARASTAAAVAGIRALVDATGAKPAATSAAVPAARTLAAFFTHSAASSPTPEPEPQEAGVVAPVASALLSSFSSAATSLLQSSAAPVLHAQPPSSPPPESENGSSQDGSQLQEAASQDSFSSYIHKNAGIVASSSSQSSQDEALSRSSSASPVRLPAAHNSTSRSAQDVAIPEPESESQAPIDQGGAWPSPSASVRSAALARHFAGSSQRSHASASSQCNSSPPQIFATAPLGEPMSSAAPHANLSILADTSNVMGNSSLSFASTSSSTRLTDTSFSFSSAAHSNNMFNGDDSLTTVGTLGDNSISLLDKAVTTSEAGPDSSEGLSSSQPLLLDPAAQSSSFARQTSFRTFMGSSWPGILHAQHQVAASVLAPAIPAQARTIVGKKRNRASLEDGVSSDSLMQRSASEGNKENHKTQAITQTDAAAELRARLVSKKDNEAAKAAARANGRKSRSSKSTSLATLDQDGYRGYRAFTLHTSSSGRAVLGFKTRAYETVAVNTKVTRAPWVPMPLPSPPPESEESRSGVVSRQIAAFAHKALERGIPLQLRKTLRVKGELLAAHREGEGDFAYGSMQEWAESDEPCSPSPAEVTSKQSAAGAEKVIEAPPATESASEEPAKQDTSGKAVSLFNSEEDKMKLYAGTTTKGAPVSPLVPNPAALGLLKPPTPSKAQYVFSTTKYGNVLGKSVNVAPIRCASAPKGFSLQFTKRAAAFTALRVALKEVPLEDGEHEGTGPNEVVKRQYIARGFCRTPSLDAVMQRGEVLDRDLSHAPAPTPPKKLKKVVRKKKAKSTVRASTPPLSPSKRVQPTQTRDEMDESVSHSESESDIVLPRLSQLSALTNSLDPATELDSGDEGHDVDAEHDEEDDDDEDEDDDAARFALSSDHYDYDASTSGIPMPVRVKRRFGGHAVIVSTGPGGASRASAGAARAELHVTDADGFRRPGAPLGAGASGSAQRRSMTGAVAEAGGDMQRSISRSSSAGQMEAQNRSWEAPSGPRFSAGMQRDRSHGAYPAPYGGSGTRPSFSAERHGVSPISSHHTTLNMGGDWMRSGPHSQGAMLPPPAPQVPTPTSSSSSAIPVHPGYAGWRESARQTARATFAHARLPAEREGRASAGNANAVGSAHGSFSRSVTMPSTLGHGSRSGQDATAQPQQLQQQEWYPNTGAVRGGFAAGPRAGSEVASAGQAWYPSQNKGRATSGQPRWTSGSSTVPGPSAVLNAQISNKASKKRPRPPVWEEEEERRIEDEEEDLERGPAGRHHNHPHHHGGSKKHVEAAKTPDTERDENQPLSPSSPGSHSPPGRRVRGGPVTNHGSNKLERVVSAPVGQLRASIVGAHRGSAAGEAAGAGAAMCGAGTLALGAPRVPLGSLANRSPPPGSAAALGGEMEDQQQAAAELLLAFGQGRE